MLLQIATKNAKARCYDKTLSKHRIYLKFTRDGDDYPANCDGWFFLGA